MSQTDIIIHDEKDNVAVVVVECTKTGQECSAWIMENNKTIKVSAITEIPLGHKIALVDLKEGDTILKYGHDIGKVIKPVKKGDHVHVHNVKTKKW
jgi:(2R)-sulfolactate sulfo-lyase subunit alpha